MSDIHTWSVQQTKDRIANRDVTVSEVIDGHLQRLEAVNPKINAIVEIPKDVQDLAKAADEAGPQDLPLWGVPVTTKCNIDQAGCVNSNGVPAYAGNLCDQDSPVVANLKAAGAIVIGRTNTPEYSMRWFTTNPLYGVTLNPWDNTVTPGGSSGGASASVALGVGAIAHGNDLGGSLRYPAFCCGVATIKPSVGRIPAYNPCGKVERPPITVSMSVQGPIARSIADVRAGLWAMAARSAISTSASSAWPNMLISARSPSCL